MLALRDPVSSSSHLLTAIWAVYATLVMFRLTSNRPGRMLPVLIFGASMIALFLASGTFHGLHYDTPGEKRFYQRLDQTAVYLLIAGTYTPVLSILLTGAWRKWFLRMVWTLAAAGISCLWLLPKAPHWLIVVIYLSLGWIGVLPVPLYYRAVGWRAMNWIWAGGLLYTVGAVCEITEWPKVMPGFGFHEVLHLCDSAANMVFFLFIVRYVIPHAPAPRAQPAPALEPVTPPTNPGVETPGYCR